MTMTDQTVSRAATSSKVQTTKLGLGALVALVIGSMIGGGVFSLPQNMASGAAPAAVLVGWLITAVGMLALAFVYQGLATRKPDLDSGPYAYARAGFGDFIGFNSAWGYWLSAWLGNVSYAVLIFGTLSYFFPAFGSGNTWQAIVGASVFLWIIHGLVLFGVREAAIVNIVTTIAKLVPILIFIVLVLVAFNAPTFSLDFWGAEAPDLGSVMSQVKSTMLVTLWVFIGIEGASVVSARAAKRSDIGRATVMGFFTALAVYVLVSLLSFGVMSQAELAKLPDAASMADVLERVAGPWGSILIRLGLLVSVAGAFLSWTLFAAEIPSVAAGEGMMPKLFGKTTVKGSPAGALWITNALVQVFLIVTYFSESTYTALFYIAGVTILVPYVFSGAYALKLAFSGETYTAGQSRTRDMIIGLIATVYGVWLVYAAGPAYLLMAALLYAPGMFFYWMVKRERGEAPFKAVEGVIAVALLIAAVVAAWLMWRGTISPL
jgi:arginine:ornithine antiporter / lysine permease